MDNNYKNNEEYIVMPDGHVERNTEDALEWDHD